LTDARRITALSAMSTTAPFPRSRALAQAQRRAPPAFPENLSITLENSVGAGIQIER
jgi:hypothetical protein